FVCISFALFAYINASPVYGNRGGYGGDRVVYEEIRVPSYGGGRGGYGPRPLYSRGEQPRAAAAAASAAAAVREGGYRQLAIPSWEIDGGYNGGRDIYGHGHGGRGP
ncbi:hypothetical protein KR009_002822, partial [Drosophila setifemur]